MQDMKMKPEADMDMDRKAQICVLKKLRDLAMGMMSHGDELEDDSDDMMPKKDIKATMIVAKQEPKEMGDEPKESSEDPELADLMKQKEELEARIRSKQMK